MVWRWTMGWGERGVVGLKGGLSEVRLGVEKDRLLLLSAQVEKVWWWKRRLMIRSRSRSQSRDGELEGLS
jgi:hypothetical protein